jgi:hypothetical protein
MVAPMLVEDLEHLLAAWREQEVAASSVAFDDREHRPAVVRPQPVSTVRKIVLA